MDAFAATRLAVGAGFLLAAAASDVRTRKVRHALWVALGTIGLLLLGAELALGNAGIERFALLPATAILFYAVFFGTPLFEEDGFHARPGRLALFGIAGALVLGSAGSVLGRGGPEATAYVQLATMPAMALVYQLFYQVGLLHGGADASAMIALTLVVPTYPEASPFPVLAPDPLVGAAMRVVFPFSLVVFVNAALLFVLVPVAYLVRNAARGDLAFPQALLGYRARLDPLPAHVWLMEKVDPRGEPVLVLFPRRGGNPEEDANRLRARGRTTAWVQPKVPFMVPLLGGFVLAFVAGNVLLALFPG